MLKASSVICKVTPSLYCLKNYTHYFQFSMFFLRIKEVQTINHSKSGPSNKNVMCWCVSIITVCFQFQNKSETHNIFVESVIYVLDSLENVHICQITQLTNWFLINRSATLLDTYSKIHCKINLKAYLIALLGTDSANSISFRKLSVQNMPPQQPKSTRDPGVPQPTQTEFSGNRRASLLSQRNRILRHRSPTSAGHGVLTVHSSMALHCR